MRTLLALAMAAGLGCSGDETPTPAPVAAELPPLPSARGGGGLTPDGLPAMPPGATLSERLSKDNGFRDAQVGRRRSEFQGLQRRKKWDDKPLGLRAYARSGEYLLVGAATVERIVYRFHEDQLFSVELLSEDLIHCSTLREVLTAMYGPGLASLSGYDQTAWWGDDVTLLFTNMAGCSAEFTWRSKHRELVVAAGGSATDLPEPAAPPAAPDPAEPGSAVE